MTLPVWNQHPEFSITRASHTVVAVTDLARSRDFYRDVVGLVVTEETSDAVYLRGLEEASHHSLVLEQAKTAQALHVGLRVRTDEDVVAAENFCKQNNLDYRRLERPFQGETIQFRDPVGTHIELTSSMDVVERVAATNGDPFVRIVSLRIY